MLASRLQLFPPSKFSPDTATPARRQRDRYVLDRLPGSSSPVSESSSTSDSHACTAATTLPSRRRSGPTRILGDISGAANVRPER
jgi:hypothetical protein